MFIRDLNDCEEFIAGDGSVLRELLHAHKHKVELNYSLAHAKVLSRHSTQPHILKTSEVYYIIKGIGLMYIEEEKKTVKAGCVVYIPPGVKQFIQNIGDDTLEFLCIVEPAWMKEDEIIIDETQNMN